MAIGNVSLRFGNARTGRYGSGGSGEPTTFDVVSGSRFWMPTGLRGLLSMPTNFRRA